MPLPNSTTPSTLAFPFTCKSHHYLKQIQLLCQTFGQVYVDLGTKGEDLARTLKQAQTQKGSMAHRGSLGKAKKAQLILKPEVSRPGLKARHIQNSLSTASRDLRQEPAWPLPKVPLTWKEYTCLGMEIGMPPKAGKVLSGR